MFKMLALLPFILVSAANASDDYTESYKRCTGELKAYREFTTVFGDLEKECRAIKMTGTPEADKGLIEPFSIKLFAAYKDMETKTKSYAAEVVVDSSWSRDVIRTKSHQCSEKNMDTYLSFRTIRESVKVCISDKGVESMDQAVVGHPELKVVMDRARCLAKKQDMQDTVKYFEKAYQTCVEEQGMGISAEIIKSEFDKDLVEKMAAYNAKKSDAILSFLTGITQESFNSAPRELAACQADQELLMKKLNVAQAKFQSCVNNKPGSARRVSRNSGKTVLPAPTNGTKGDSSAQPEVPKATP